MANLNLWREKLRAHVREFLPATYRGLMQAGKLETYLDRKVDEAARIVDQLRQTMTEAEAQSEMMREWLPTPEPETEEPMEPQEIERLIGQLSAQDS